MSFVAINISEEKPEVVDDYYTGIPVLKSKEEVLNFLTETLECGQDGYNHETDFQIIELNQKQFEIADLICLFFNNEKSADFILNIDNISKLKIDHAYHNKQVFEKNKYSIDAVELFDNFLAEINICKLGEFTSRFIEERDAEPRKDVFASIYDE